MSWIINEQSKTGNNQYLIANYSTTVSATSFVNPINVSGYSHGTVYLKKNAGATNNPNLLLQGSNNGIEWFTISGSLTLTTLTPSFLSWIVPVKFIRVSVSGIAGSIIDAPQVMVISANDGGQASAGGGGKGSLAGGKNKEIQYNNDQSGSNSFGGATNASYDKAHTQVNLANGTTLLPMLAFSDGTHPAGTYDTGIYRNAVNSIGFTSATILALHISRNQVSVDNILNLKEVFFDVADLIDGTTIPSLPDFTASSFIAIRNSTGNQHLIRNMIPPTNANIDGTKIILTNDAIEQRIRFQQSNDTNGFILPGGGPITWDSTAGNHAGSITFIYDLTLNGGSWICVSSQDDNMP